MDIDLRLGNCLDVLPTLPAEYSKLAQDRFKQARLFA